MVETYSDITRCNDCPFIDRTQYYEWNDCSCSISDEVEEMKSDEFEAGVPAECPLHQGPVAVGLKEGVD